MYVKKKKKKIYSFQVQSGSLLTGADSRLRSPVRPAVVGSRQGHHRVERKRPRGIVYIRAGRRIAVLAEARHGPHLPGAPSCRRRVRVLLEAAVGDAVQRAQLLRRIRQCGSHDECRREFVVFVPGRHFLTSFIFFFLGFPANGCRY